MPDKEFIDRLQRVLTDASKRIAALENNVEKEYEARMLQRVITPFIVQLGHIRTEAINDEFEDNPDMTFRELAMIMNLSPQHLNRLAHRAELQEHMEE